MPEGDWISDTRKVANSLNEARDLLEQYELILFKYIDSLSEIELKNNADSNDRGALTEQTKSIISSSVELLFNANINIITALLYSFRIFDACISAGSKVNLVIANNNFNSINILLLTSNPVFLNIFYKYSAKESILNKLKQYDSLYIEKFGSSKDSGMKRLMGTIIQNTKDKSEF